MKTLGGNADDSIRMEVNLHGAADDGAIGAEVVTPEVVIEDDFVLAGGFGLFRREKEAAENRMDTEDVEVVGGNECAIDAGGLTDAGDGHVVVVVLVLSRISA
jgi:hypothetical protein